MWFQISFFIFPSLSFLSYTLDIITISDWNTASKTLLQWRHTVCTQSGDYYYHYDSSLPGTVMHVGDSMWTRIYFLLCTTMCDTFQLFEDRCHVPPCHIHSCPLWFLSYFSQHKISPCNPLLSGLHLLCFVSVFFFFFFGQCPFRI